ncbi:MAG: xanthine dehydrogenase family protein molybdopterin-binding subunit [Candidatus Rokuibacteriota bacterium]
MSFLQSRSHSARQGIGKPVLRKEDERLVKGAGCFSDDFNLPGQAYACFVRSPHAHARIRRVDGAPALELPGVISVLTGADAAADGLQPIPHRPVPANPYEPQLRNRDGSPHFVAPHALLPVDRVRLVGEAVAMVIADSAAAARDGAEAVVVDYEPLAVVTTAADATAADAPLVWHEAGSNVCVDSDCGDAAAADAAFARAAYVVQRVTRVNRVTGVPMEPRAALAVYDAERDHYTLYAGSGGVQRIKHDLVGTLGVSESAVRVIAREVGGNYGTRNAFYPEFALVPWGAKRLRRPVKWTCERREALLTDFHARDLVSRLELALDRDGNFLAFRGVHTSNVGAHAVSFIPLGKGVGVLPSLYHFPTAYVRARAVLTNTSPTYPYRSAGRPEVMYVMERLIDTAARRHGFDRVALRRRNLVPSSAMPYRNPMGLLYDSGDYPAVQDRAVALADWAGFEPRRAEARRRGRYRGIGLSNYLELNTGAPRERADITVRPDGRIDVVVGTLSSGQGHETSFAQLIVEWFAVDLEQVSVITGDTDVAPVGGGSHSGRSMRQAGVVMAKASDAIVERGTRIAAWRLEAAAADIEFAQGRFTVKGTDRAIGLFEIAAAALRSDAPSELAGPLAGTADETISVPSFPYGCAVCEVEIDPETGVVEIDRYAVVDDVGRVINPMICRGQIEGALAQGIGQALMENVTFDRESGQMLSASFADYAMPRAADLPPHYELDFIDVPTKTNPLGVKGVGEAGCVGAPPVVMNAILDALRPLGVEHLDMPATSHRVWRAIHKK